MTTVSFGVFEHISEPVLVLKKDGTVTYLNPAAASFFPEAKVGVKAEKFIQSPLLGLSAEGAVGSVLYRDTPYTASLGLLSGLRTLVILAHAEKARPVGEPDLLRATERELRNALGVTELASSLIEKRARELGDLTLLRYVGFVSHSRHRLTRITDHLAVLWEPEDETDPTDEKTLDLIALCRDIVSTVSYLTAEKGVAISLVSELTELPFVGYERRLNQLILNLISNSLKATPRDGKIVVSVAQDGKTALLSVQDTGTGIPPERAAKLFSPGGPRGLREDGSGLGLGLYAVSRCARLHGGGVVVESREGKGTKITVSLRSLREPAELKAPGFAEERDLDIILTELADILGGEAYLLSDKS